MPAKIQLSKHARELVFQLVLHLLALIFYASDRRHPEISLQEFVYFLHYAAIAAVVNYVLLPRYLYTKKYKQFFWGLLLAVTVLMLVEELILESVFFPDTRARAFPGVFFTLVQVLPMMVVLIGFKFAWDALMKQHEVETLKAAVQESELLYLKSQINPHFLFNNLNNLYAYALENSAKTPEIILELSGVLRYMLYECREDYVPLDKEVEQLYNIFKISELQIEDRGHVQFVAGEIPPGFEIAPLMLTVFIENAFKHSTASQSDNIRIDIALQVSAQGVLHFSCKNSYRQQSNTEQLGKGIGLGNVQKRLEMLYPRQHSLQINQSAEQFEVLLNLQLQKTTGV